MEVISTLKETQEDIQNLGDDDQGNPSVNRHCLLEMEDVWIKESLDGE
jgi:hypothetical protein